MSIIYPNPSYSSITPLPCLHTSISHNRCANDPFAHASKDLFIPFGAPTNHSYASVFICTYPSSSSCSIFPVLFTRQDHLASFMHFSTYSRRLCQPTSHRSLSSYISWSTSLTHSPTYISPHTSFTPTCLYLCTVHVQSFLP